MKTKNKLSRKLMRARNRERVNRLRHQKIILAPVFILVLIKLGLDEITTPAKMLLRLLLHIDKLTGNANFPTTVPTIATLQSTADALSETIVAIEAGDHSLIPHRDTLMLTAENHIRKLSFDIQNQSNGDAEKIQSAGFEVRKGRGASQPVGGVVNLKSKPVGPGKIKLSFKRVANSKLNFIETTANPVTGPWIPLGKTTRSSYTVEGLTPGSLHYFRVYGSNSLGDGNPSEPVEQRSL